MKRTIPTVTMIAIIALVSTTAMIVPAGAAPFSPPRVERIIGGASRPFIGAWGLAYNPVTDELIVGDYVSNQIRRFSRAGTHLGDFTNPKGSTEGTASGVAVDPRDGSIYLAVTGDGRTSKSVRKYSASGVFLFDFNLSGSVTWLTVDAQGDLWVPEAFGGTRVREWRVNDVTRTATALTSAGSGGSGPGQLKRLTGIDVDAAGNIYVADPGNKIVHSFAPNGSWRFDIGGPSLFPGDIRGIVVDDATGKLFVANSQAGTIEVFSLSGTWLSTFSSLGTEPGQFRDGARGLAITPDGHLWAADYGSRRVQEFTQGGTWLDMFPEPPMLADEAGLAGARGVAVDPVTGDVLVSDPWNQRVQRFASDGSLIQAFGKRGSFPPDGMNYPRSVAVDPATRNVWVGNYEGNPDLMVFTPDFQVVRRILTPRFVNDIEIVGDEAYVLVRRPGDVRVYDTTTGQLIRTCCNTFGQLRGIAVDPTSGNLWLTSDTSAKMFVVTPSGSLIREIALDGRGWGVTMVGDLVYVSDAQANRILAFDRLSYARIGQFGTAGFLPGQLRGPSGLASDADGRLYVVEERSGRVQVFGPSPLPEAESVAPTLTWTSPTAVATPPVVATGTASDVSGVLLVEAQVRDESTGLYWNAKTSLWGSAIVWNGAPAWGATTSPSWRFTVVPSLPGRNYTVKVRASDVHGNRSNAITRLFSVS